MVFIYVIKCDNNKWYIGKTENSKFRIDTHFDKNGSRFTKMFHPIEIYQIIPECDKFDEDKYVKKYMEKYGIDNVRGGTYSRLELTQQEKTFIQKELWGANNLCFECGGEHFIKDCPNNKHPVILQSSITENNDNKKNEFLTNLKNELFELTEGCWIKSKKNKQCGNYDYYPDFPDKIYKRYDETPLSESLSYKTELSDEFILQKQKQEVNTSKNIEVKYYLMALPLTYSYKYSIKYYNIDLNSQLRPVHKLSKIDIINIKTYDKQVNDLKLKIFMLENMNLSENEDNNMMLVD